MSMKSDILRDMTPYNLVEIYKRSSETSVNLHQITWSYILKDSGFIFIVVWTLNVTLYAYVEPVIIFEVVATEGVYGPWMQSSSHSGHWG
jgi:hypothetical protein